jgi:hypothetical protein
MDLLTWIPLTIGLGVLSMILCYAFLVACNRI